MQPGDQIHRPDGSPVEFEPGDMMRMAFHDNTDPSSGLAYQYLVRRVAYMDDSGNLVKTKAYEELKRRALMPEPEQTQLVYLWWLHLPLAVGGGNSRHVHTIG